MKSPLLVALLILSAVLNAVLAFYPFNPTPPSPAPALPAPSNAPSPAAALPADTMVWTPPKSAEDIPSTVARLRAAGFPPSAVRAAINALLNERYDPKSLIADLPFWKRNYPGPEIIAAQQKLAEEKNTLFKSLLGDDARPSASMDPTDRKLRFGALPDDKVDAIAEIEKDYGSIGSLASAEAKGDYTAYSEQRKLLEKEKLADLQAVLTPEQFEQYQMRNSSSAQDIMRATSKIELTESEYAALYQARNAFDSNNPMNGGRPTSEQSAHRAEEQRALNEKSRAILGDDRFYSYLAASDFMYGQVAQLSAKYPEVTPALSYQLYQLQNEARQALRTPNQTATERRAAMAPYVEKLNALASPEVITAYQKTQAGIFFASYNKAANPAPAAK